MLVVDDSGFDDGGVQLAGGAKMNGGENNCSRAVLFGGATPLAVLDHTVKTTLITTTSSSMVHQSHLMNK